MKRLGFLIFAAFALLSTNGALLAFGGTVPAGLPSNFGIGCIDKNDNWSGDSTGPHRWKMGQSCFDYSYQYLTSGWRTWSSPDGQWPVNELTLWESQGENQVFTFYYNNGAASLPSTWFADLMVLMQKIEANSTKKVIIHIEPDFLGFCIQKSQTNYNQTGIVTVGSGTAPSGWPGTGTQAWNNTNYPDTLQGWVKAIRDMQKLVAPNHVLIAHHFTVWGASSGSSGDAFGQPTSQADVDNILTQIANYMKNIGGGSTSYMDLFFMDPSDRDAAWYNQYNAGSNLRWSAENYSPTWGSRSWGTLAYVADKASSLMGQRCMFWQMPNGNHFYKLMNNSDGHYQDNYTQAFLPATNSNGSSGSPGDAISASSTSTGPGYWANHGLIGVLFGEGYYAAIPPGGSTNLTHLRDYGPADGVGTVGAYTSYGGPGGVSPGQGQAGLTTYSDNDGGYLRLAVANYCSVGKFPLPGATLPTATTTPCTACTATVTPTLTPAPADCPLLFNSCDSLTSNGTWSGSNSTLALNTTGTYYDQGAGSVKVTVNTATAFNANVANLAAFAPTDWSSYDRVSMDVYVDPAHLLTTTASTWCNLSVALDGGGGTPYYQADPTVPSGSSTGTAAPLVAGWNHLSFPLYWGAANNNSAVVATGLTKFYVIPNVGVAAAGAVFYIDNIVLHTDQACPTSTPTPTYNPNTATPTPSPSPTPADCPLVFNNCDSLTANGTWTPSSGTAAVNTNAAYATSGNSMQFTVTGALGFQDKLSVLAGFAPTDWRSFDRITFDLYIDPVHPLWATGSVYDQFQLRVTNSSAAQYEADPTGTAALTVTTGWNHLSFPLSWATVNGNGITFLFLVPSVGTPAAGAIYYIDNIVLHTDTVCPPPTATFTVSPTPSATRTGTATASPTATPSATRTNSASPTATSSATPTPTVAPATATLTASPSPSATRSVTASATPSSSSTASPTPSATASVTGTKTPSPTPSISPSPSGSPSVTVTSTPPPPGSTATSTSTISPTYSVSPSPSVTVTRSATPTSTVLPSATTTATAMPTYTVPPTATLTATLGNSATASPSPAGTLTSTPQTTATTTAVPSATATLMNSSTPTPSVTVTFMNTATATPSATVTTLNTATVTPSATVTATALPTGTVTPSVTPPPPGSTATATATVSASSTVTGTATRTETATPSASPSRTPSPTGTLTATGNPTASPTPTAALSSLGGGPASDAGGSLLTLTGVNLPAGGTVYWDGSALPVGSVQVLTAGQTWQISSPVSTAGVHVITVGGVSGSLNVTVVASPKATPTATPTVGGGTLVVEGNNFYPNPWGAGLAARFALKLSGSAERVHLKIYTEALVAVGSVDLGAAVRGWNSFSLPVWVVGLPNGTYYYVISAERGVVKAARPAVGKLVVIR